VPSKLTVAREPVLKHVPPLKAPFRVVAERGQRHSQVAGREHAELVTQPSTGAAIVGNRHHSRDPVGEQPKRREGGGKTVSATKGHHDRAGHSRPRSR